MAQVRFLYRGRTYQADGDTLEACGLVLMPNGWVVHPYGWLYPEDVPLHTPLEQAAKNRPLEALGFNHRGPVLIATAVSPAEQMPGSVLVLYKEQSYAVPDVAVTCIVLPDGTAIFAKQWFEVTPPEGVTYPGPRYTLHDVKVVASNLPRATAVD